MALTDRIAALERDLEICRARRSAAEDAELRLRMFVDSVHDYAFIVFDLEGRVVGWSRGAELLLGFSQEEAIGLSTAAFFTPEDVAAGEDLKELALARRDGRAEDERWHMRRDGTRFWGSGVMSPLLDPDGELRGFTKVMRDHTSRRLAEALLRDSEERLRLYCENIHDYALVPVDLEGHIVGWNSGAARIFGYTTEKILGQHCRCFFTPEDRARREPELDLQRAVDEGRAEDERWMVREDGSRFWAHWITTPIRDAHGQLRGFAKILHDNSERKAAEDLRERLLAQERRLLQLQVQSTGQALDRTKEELRALAGSLIGAQEDERRRIARELHDDLSQRLALLSNDLVRLRMSPPDDPTQLRAEIQRLERFVDGLSKEVRHLSHRLHPAILDDLGLAPALRRLVEEFQAGRARPVTFTADDLPAAIPHDVAAALYRVAQEALRNIAKHAGSDPVHVQLGHTDGELRLVVTDAGPGFDPAAARGRGLGIISMHERAHLVGGTVRLTSRPGEGTTIDMRVPLNPARS